MGANYLSLLLTGEGATELGDARSIVSVAFQQAPRVPVDDLVILAARSDEPSPSLELAVGIRRSPNIVRSNADTQNLVTEYVRAMLSAPQDALEHRLVLVVAGHQPHAAQLGELAALAQTQVDASRFFTLVREPGRFRQELVGRLGHVVDLVREGLRSIGITDVDDDIAEQRTWELLARLSVLMPRFETPDLSDWDGLRNRLASVSRNGLDGAGHLRDRLESLAAEFGPVAATVDRTILRRRVHADLEATATRRENGWAALNLLQDQAFAGVRDHIGFGDPDRTMHLERAAEGSLVVALTQSDAAGLLVVGESGVGKSALALHAARAGSDASPDAVEVVCLNLRQLPTSPLDLMRNLGCSLAELLAEMSAPHRVLVVDAADAATETHSDMFTYLLSAARDSEVRLMAISTTDASRVVRDLLSAQLQSEMVELPVEGLSDRELDEVVTQFPELTRLASNARSRELLRRLVVADLIVRSNSDGVPLSDIDTMQEIWAGVVRRHGQSDRGQPDAREQALVQLARRELFAADAMSVVGTLDAAAVDGLRQDGVLRSPVTNPWQILPEFAHDEIRRFAVARVLLAAGDPVRELLAANAPRWAMSAARLACQAMLAPPGEAVPPADRFATVQAAFDALVSAGYGERWGDIPSEALLTLGDPSALLADAWPELRAGDGAGLQRMFRIVEQRHRVGGVFIDPVILEPIVELMLSEATPWSEPDMAKALREWLVSLVARDTAIGHPPRIRLRELLVAACEVGERRLVEQREEAEAASAARTPEEMAADEEFVARHRGLFTEIGFGGRERRERAQLPGELTNDTVIELLALLGPDLGEQGEALLRRVGAESPWDLAPALEEVLTGRAVTGYGRGLLAELTEAYYLDDEENGSGLHEDGIRDHRWRGPVTPLTAWYRGPFMALFQSDLRGGVAVLNRLLNHAASVRVREMAAVDPWTQVSDEELERLKTGLRITGDLLQYAGDSHVWCWYRASTVGPFPCMSALQALERLCDQLIAADFPLDRIVALLLDGCENLAMLGLVVGLLVRHLDRAGSLLDPFLREPVIWGLEFERIVHEFSSMAPGSLDLVESERRKWSFREVSTWLVVHADEDRVVELRSIGERLINAAERMVALAAGADESPGDDEPSTEISTDVTYITTVRNWASALDRDRYRVYSEEGVTYITSDPPQDVRDALESGNDDLRRGQEAANLLWRHSMNRKVDPDGRGEPPEGDLASDLLTAQSLLDDPPVANATGLWDSPAAVGASAIEAVVLRDTELPVELIGFVVNTVVAVAEGAQSPREFEYEGTYFEQGADRSAARALPLLLLPAAEPLLDACGIEGEVTGPSRVVEAGHHLARAVPNETRLHLARGLDPVWETPCQSGTCHHEIGLELAIESMRDSLLGDWDYEAQSRSAARLGDPVIQSLAATPDDALYVARLDAAIRALGVAAARDTCVRAEARELLMVLLAAQRRGLLAHEHNYDHRGSSALVAARALLELAATGDEDLLHEHIAAFADSEEQLGSFLRALAAAAEENERRAAAARTVWPRVIEQVTGLLNEGHHPFSGGYFGEAALAAVIPTRAYDAAFMYRELQSAPIEWTDGLAWRREIEAWLPFVAGHPQCVDSLVGLVNTFPLTEQATVGLRWVASVVQPAAGETVRRSYRLSEWLISIRSAATDSGVIAEWQRLVDALVVAGDTQLAPYSD